MLGVDRAFWEVNRDQYVADATGAGAPQATVAPDAQARLGPDSKGRRYIHESEQDTRRGPRATPAGGFASAE